MATSGRTNSSPTSTTPAVIPVDSGAVVRRARRATLLALTAVAVLTPPVLAAVRWPRWWTWIASEDTPMTWLQSVVLVLAAAGCALLVLVLRLAAARAGDIRAWVLLSAGFAALAFDERFSVHERVRDGILAPRGIRIPLLTWVAPGDFLLLCVALVGLAALPIVWRAVRVDVGARTALAVGVALAAVAVSLDSIDPSTWSEGAERVQQSLEEVVELASALCFLAAVVLRLLTVLERLRLDS